LDLFSKIRLYQIPETCALIEFGTLQAEGSSADCIAALARVDNVKQRMEAAYKTLQVSIHSDFVIHYVDTWG